MREPEEAAMDMTMMQVAVIPVAAAAALAVWFRGGRQGVGRQGVGRQGVGRQGVLTDQLRTASGAYGLLGVVLLVAGITAPAIAAFAMAAGWRAASQVAPRTAPPE